MSTADTFLIALGVYLAVALTVAAWRRSSQSFGGVAVWVALLGAWLMGVAGRWLSPTPLAALGAAAAYAVVASALSRLGTHLGTRGELHGWAWLLGPVHAMGLAVTWAAAARLRRRQAARVAVAPPGVGQMHAAVESVVELGETTLDEVMVPRSEIQALPEASRVADWLTLARESRRSRVPVYREDLDEIVGYLHTGDLFATPPPEAAIAPFVRPIRFVPETMRCDDLLRDQINQGEKIAVVVDEFGGTAGLVTNRDLFEILLGEIDQESGERGLWKVSPRVYFADGGLRIDDFNDLFATPLPEGKYETVAGLLLARLGRIPERGERITVGDIEIEVSAASPRRILRVRVTLPAAAEGTPGGDR